MKPTPLSRTAYQRGDDPEHLTSREWLVTNALGGYASGSIGGVMTRRFHGLLVAALNAPLGRTILFNQLREQVRVDDTHAFCLEGQEPLNRELELPTNSLESFCLEDGLPVWRHTYAGVTLEKRIFMPHLHNTTIVTYRLEKAPAPVELELRCGFFVRRHEGQFAARIDVSEHGEVRFPYQLEKTALGLELFAGDPYPCLRFMLQGTAPPLFVPAPSVVDLLYRVERSRGYDFHGPIFCPGLYRIRIDPGQNVAFFASTEAWSAFQQASADELLQAEFDRRRACRQAAHPALQDGLGAELVLAADQFVIIPRIRSNEEAQAQNRRRLHTVIAGYHWFTDWGRDTMISLEGLTLLTGRHDEARDILNTFAQHARNGLIPNLFPEGGTEGLYHTADATLWFFQALSRYERLTGDQETGRALLPKLLEIIDAHVRGTWFGIGVDPADGLLTQGAEGYQLTWMDAKVDDWVVTPRRGKAVEINALYYNALRLLEDWLLRDGQPERALHLGREATRAKKAFNERFWYEAGGYLYDVIDGPADAPAGQDDPAFRPNQILAISLTHPVLAAERWLTVVSKVYERLLTPVGLRSLAPDHPDYKPRYDGDLRARDAAYHQGTVWAWLIGPFLDAWLKVYPTERARARELVLGFGTQLSGACIGSISEIFDSEEPFAPRGCVAQAWSIAEVIRALVAIDSQA